MTRDETLYADLEKAARRDRRRDLLLIALFFSQLYLWPIGLGLGWLKLCAYWSLATAALGVALLLVARAWWAYKMSVSIWRFADELENGWEASRGLNNKLLKELQRLDGRVKPPLVDSPVPPPGDIRAWLTGSTGKKL